MLVCNGGKKEMKQEQGQKYKETEDYNNGTPFNGRWECELGEGNDSWIQNSQQATFKRSFIYILNVNKIDI